MLWRHFSSFPTVMEGYHRCAYTCGVSGWQKLSNTYDAFRSHRSSSGHDDEGSL